LAPPMCLNDKLQLGPLAGRERTLIRCGTCPPEVQVVG